MWHGGNSNETGQQSSDVIFDSGKNVLTREFLWSSQPKQIAVWNQFIFVVKEQFSHISYY